jgi:hypothetical protein
MGTPTHPFETPRKAKVWMESIIDAEIKPNEKSKVLANNIIIALADQAPFYASADYLRAQTYWLNGPKLCEALEIPKPSMLAMCLISARIVGVAVTSLVMKSIPLVDRWNIGKARAFMKESLMSKDGMDGKLTSFQFQYIPRYGKTTLKGQERPGRGMLHEKSLERTIIGWSTLFFALVGVAIGVANIGSVRLAVVGGLHSLSP